MVAYGLADKIRVDLAGRREVRELRIGTKSATGHGARGRRRVCIRSVEGRSDDGELCAIEQIVPTYRAVILVEGQIELHRIASHERVPSPVGAPGAKENLQTLEARHLVQGGAIGISDPSVAVEAHLVDDVHPAAASGLGCRAATTEGEPTNIGKSNDYRMDGVAILAGCVSVGARVYLKWEPATRTTGARRSSAGDTREPTAGGRRTRQGLVDKGA